MVSSNSSASTDTSPPGLGERTGWTVWISAALSLGVILWFYGFEARFGPSSTQSSLGWLYGAWNPETDYEHGKLIPVIALGLIYYRRREISASFSKGSLWGLLLVLAGVLFHIAACRTVQPRISLVGLPFMLCGGVAFLWGWRVAKLMLFPFFFLWMAIPLPAFQQATTQLQLIATAMAHHGSALFGVETYTQGTTVLPIKGDWKPLSIAHGCSGIRSLMALLMISSTWAYVARMALWKRVLLFLCAFPLAIIGNSLRVVSIFVIAEYGNARWASTTWHDWSGLLLFYPFSLLMLLLINTALEGGLPWKRVKRRELRRVTVSAPQPGTGVTPP